jgi:hypothetical protein
MIFRSQRKLQEVCPLHPHQQYFRQSTWGQNYAPNLASVPIDSHTRNIILPNSLLEREPDQPWLRAEVMIIRGHFKMKGWVKHVRRDRSPSGLNINTVEQGGLRIRDIDYTWLRDVK